MKKLVDANSDAATHKGSMSEHDCAKQCLDNYPACVAIDYNRADRYCYWHSRLSAANMQWNDCCNRYMVFCLRT